MFKRLTALLVAMLMVCVLVPAVRSANAEAPEEEPKSVDCIASWGFETDPVADGWTYVDADGDGYSWFHFNTDSWGEYYAYEGDYYMSSPSYNINFTMFPNNWLISPMIYIPRGISTFSFYAAGTGEGSCEEHFAAYICVGDSSSPSSFTQILPETVATADYVQYTADISDYGEQYVRLAIRHFNCSMVNWFRVDQVEVFNEYIPIPIEEVSIEGFTIPVWGAHPDFDLTVSDDVPYSVTFTSWVWSNGYTSSELGATDVFDNENGSYYQYIELTPAEGYAFVSRDEITVLINGSASIVNIINLYPTGILRVFTRYYSVYEPDPPAGLLGDVDGSGTVTAVDATLILRHAMSISSLSGDAVVLADVDGSGSITVADALYVLRYAMNIITQFPAQS